MSKYKVVRELGRNYEGGRTTYLATDTSLNPPLEVVIKEFRFAAAGANWSGLKAHEREIEVLRELEHPRIPRYLDSFETKAGFCLVQEYKNAPSLAVQRSFNPEQIKQIAESVLEILAYLQKRVPPVIHRDIKPENILVDKQLNAYLVDFGFARIRGGELAMSSVAAGTPGFMPPEEQFGRPLTETSDLYSLGATLICLLAGTRSVDVGKLIDDDYRFDFKKLVPQLSPRFVEWLTKMVEPNLKNRYANAAVALEALKPIQVKGSATGVEILVRIIKSRTSAPVLGLVLSIFCVFALLSRTSTSLRPSTSNDSINVEQITQAQNLAGVWQCNDGGLYFIRQVGNQVWWYGESGDGGVGWSNVFHGYITGNKIIGTWADVPKGTARNYGEMTLWNSGNRLSKISGGQNFSGSVWSR
ncbi:MAG TPA: serine/threonine-protein kinase [Oculatellaceae cyanobacterium]